MSHDESVALEDRAGHDVAVVALLDLVAAIGDDRVGHRALPGALRESPGDLQRVALLGDHERHLGRLLWLLRLDLGVGRSLASTLVLRKLALRAVEHPRAGELRLRLGGGHADPEQEQGHHANRALQASHSSSLQELSGLTTAGRPTLFTVDQPVSCGGPRRRDELIRGAGDRTGRHEIMDDWTGGRAVVELLKAEGVRQIFGIVGATFLDVLDTLYHDSSVEYINVRHEQAAAFMADGLARVTDRPGVCLVTSGPGATNLLTGVAAAYVAHSPVVVLVGGIALDHYQKDAFQEFDLVGMFRPVTKQALQITKADRIPELLRGALRTAMSGRQGPVFVEIPRDVLNGTLPPTAALAPGRYRVTHAQPPHADAVREAAQRLRQAERPLLLVGGGASRAGANELVVQLSDRYGIPMITAYGRNDAVPNGHPLYLGPLGRAGAPEAAAACRRADLILAVGSRLAQFPTQFGGRYLRSGTALVQIDLEEIGRAHVSPRSISAASASPSPRHWAPSSVARRRRSSRSTATGAT